MPQRHPLSPSVPPPLLERLDARLLAGADAAALEREVARDPALAAEVQALRALGLSAATARELHDLARIGALRLELCALERHGAHAAARRAATALLAARLTARIARRSARAPTPAPGELACLPFVRALARARLEVSGAGPKAVAREAVAIARAWGCSGAAIEVLAGGEERPEQHLLELAERLAGGSDAARGAPAYSGLERAARAVGLRSAELAELADFAASARATTAA